MRQIPPRSTLFGAIQVVLIVASVGQPSNCACDQSSLRPLPLNFPMPEEGTEFTQMVLQEMSSAVTGGGGGSGGTAMPGRGEAIWEGFAPTVVTG
jgi:hypothetical protein